MGEPYELIEPSVRSDDLQKPAYLRLNPNARIPTLVDGDTVLWELMAINLYLAQKPGPMHAASSAVTGLAAQWSFWAMLETEALLLDLLSHRVLLAEHVRDPSHVERNTLLLQKPLGILNQALSDASTSPATASLSPISTWLDYRLGETLATGFLPAPERRALAGASAREIGVQTHVEFADQSGWRDVTALALLSLSLVRPGRHGETERLGGLEVDDRLGLRRRLTHLGLPYESHRLKGSR